MPSRPGLGDRLVRRASLRETRAMSSDARFSLDCGSSKSRPSSLRRSEGPPLRRSAPTHSGRSVRRRYRYRSLAVAPGPQSLLGWPQPEQALRDDRHTPKMAPPSSRGVRWHRHRTAERHSRSQLAILRHRHRQLLLWADVHVSEVNPTPSTARPWSAASPTSWPLPAGS
jgi:hypothetical protein